MAIEIPSGFYVYLHRRQSDGLIFYVGKGFGRRAWEWSEKSRGNIHWQRVKNKHGIEVVIVKSAMSNDCSLTLEKITIAKYRSLGHPLTNMTDGGDGFSGVDNQIRIENLVKVMGKPIFSSMGDYFNSISAAALWLSDNGHPNAQASGISAVARGQRKFAYGRSWSYDDMFPEHPKITNCVEYASELISKPVKRSDGVIFKSSYFAAQTMAKESNPKISSSSITKACKGILKTAYGYTWEYV